MTRSQPKVALFSSILLGGAGKAAVRVHKSLLLNGVESTLFTRDNQKRSNIPSTVYLEPEIEKQWDLLQSSHHMQPGYTIFSINEPNIHRKTLEHLVKDIDIINIHWVARFLTVEDIGYLSHLGKPVVITIRDMHPLAGGCHYFHHCNAWQTDCRDCPQLLDDNDQFPSKVLAAKKQYWNMDNIVFVALSEQSKTLLKQSAIYKDNIVKVIPNPIDLERFRPYSQQNMKAFFHIETADALLFYLPAYVSIVKGGHEFQEALQLLKENYPNFKLTLLIGGSSTSLVSEEAFPYPVIHLGTFGDDTQLAKAYALADATIIPSLEEGFPNTAAESLACGTPIIGFQVGAIPEMAGNGERGKSVKTGDTLALSHAIYHVLSTPPESPICRKYAEENFNFKRQGEKYKKLFNTLHNTISALPSSNARSIPEIDPSLAPLIYQRSINSFHTKQTKLDNKEIYRFRNSFDQLGHTSFMRHPIKKIKLYILMMQMMKEYKREKPQSIPYFNLFLNAYNSLCAYSIKRSPHKKFKQYKNLMHTWYKYQKHIHPNSTIELNNDISFSKKIFKEKMGYPLNLENPKTLNEKIQWLKLYDRTNLHTFCADKYKVRQYISTKIGIQYLIPLYFVSDSVEDITYENLPNKPFVIKTNHDSGSVVLVKDKHTIDIPSIQNYLSTSMKKNYYYVWREWQYKNIKPKILIEALLLDEEGKIPKDFKLHCFNGICRFIAVSSKLDQELRINLYDTHWNPIECEWAGKRGLPVQQPSNLNEMVRVAEILANPFKYVRVDLYSYNKKIYIGELTFHPTAGFGKFQPESCDLHFGKMLDLLK